MAKQIDGIHYERVTVVHVPIDGLENTLHINQEINTPIMDLLVFIADLPLRDQIFMLSNTLTISGYTQREISEAMGVNYKTYRNTLLDIRKTFKDKIDRF